MMNALITPENKHFFLDKEAVRKLIAEDNAAAGFVPDLSRTPEQVQESMAAGGIRAEDNIFSCGIIAMRDEE